MCICSSAQSIANLTSTQSSTAQHSTAQHSTAQHSTAQHSTAQHSTAQHSTAQHSTAQHSTAQHSTAQAATRAPCATYLQVELLCLQLAATPVPSAQAYPLGSPLAFPLACPPCLQRDWGPALVGQVALLDRPSPSWLASLLVASSAAIMVCCVRRNSRTLCNFGL